MVVNVVPVESVSSRLETVSDAQASHQESVLDEARSILASHGVHSLPIAVCGSPCSRILTEAQKSGAQILVVGRGRRWRHLFGTSLAFRLANRAPQDVLVVG